MIHRDTSFLIRALGSGSPEDRALRGWLASGARQGVGAGAWSEPLCGPIEPEAARLAAEVVGDPVPLDAAAAELAARLFNQAGRRRGSMVDCFIAAGALSSGARLTTANETDFLPFSDAGLILTEL